MFLVVFYITIKITEYENLLLIPQNNPQTLQKGTLKFGPSVKAPAQHWEDQQNKNVHRFTHNLHGIKITMVEYFP